MGEIKNSGERGTSAGEHFVERGLHKIGQGIGPSSQTKLCWPAWPADSNAKKRQDLRGASSAACTRCRGKTRKKGPGLGVVTSGKRLELDSENIIEEKSSTRRGKLGGVKKNRTALPRRRTARNRHDKAWAGISSTEGKGRK